LLAKFHSQRGSKIGEEKNDEKLTNFYLPNFFASRLKCVDHFMMAIQIVNVFRIFVKNGVYCLLVFLIGDFADDPAGHLFDLKVFLEFVELNFVGKSGNLWGKVEFLEEVEFFVENGNFRKQRIFWKKNEILWGLLFEIRKISTC
jgi:hypothetical protein